MINLILTIAEISLFYIMLIFLHRKYQNEGIIIFSIISTILSVIMILKNISIMGISIPLGITSITSLIIGGNILTQSKGPEEIKKYILIIIITFIITWLFIIMSSQLNNSNYNIVTNEAYNNIFNNNVRIYIALIISTIISITISSKIYFTLKRIRNKIIISNIFSVVISAFVESILFILMAYLFEWPIIDIVLSIFFRYIIKAFIGIVGTIPIYIISNYNE